MATRYTIRPLTNADLFRVTDMLVDLVEQGVSKIGDVLVSQAPVSADKTKKMSPAQVEKLANKRGVKVVSTVLKECWKHSRSEMQEWFSDLCSMSVEDYMGAPAGLTIDIFESFQKDPSNHDFFSRALRVASTMSEPVERLLARLGLSDTITGSAGKSSES